MNAEILSTEEAYPEHKWLTPETQAVLAYEKNGVDWLDPDQLVLVTAHFERMWMEIIKGQVVEIKN